MRAAEHEGRIRRINRGAFGSDELDLYSANNMLRQVRHSGGFH
jgi:hypothetical protein